MTKNEKIVPDFYKSEYPDGIKPAITEDSVDPMVKALLGIARTSALTADDLAESGRKMAGAINKIGFKFSDSLGKLVQEQPKKKRVPTGWRFGQKVMWRVGKFLFELTEKAFRKSRHVFHGYEGWEYNDFEQTYKLVDDDS